MDLKKNNIGNDVLAVCALFGSDPMSKVLWFLNDSWQFTKYGLSA